MNVTVQIDAVERRIAQLDGSPVPDAAAFAQLLRPLPAAPTAAAATSALPPAYDGLVMQSAARCGVDPALVRAVIACESGGNPSATSATGAAGLMQLMPATAAALGVRDPYDPAENIGAGTRYLRSLLDRFGGDVPRAVAAYNAGPGAVERYDGVPPYAETQHYVRAVLDAYASARS